MSIMKRLNVYLYWKGIFGGNSGYDFWKTQILTGNTKQSNTINLTSIEAKGGYTHQVEVEQLLRLILFTLTLSEWNITITQNNNCCYLIPTPQGKSIKRLRWHVIKQIPVKTCHSIGTEEISSNRNGGKELSIVVQLRWL